MGFRVGVGVGVWGRDRGRVGGRGRGGVKDLRAALKDCLKMLPVGGRGRGTGRGRGRCRGRGRGRGRGRVRLRMLPVKLSDMTMYPPGKG